MVSSSRFGWLLATLMGVSTLVVIEACAKDSGGSGSTGEKSAPTVAAPNAVPETVPPSGAAPTPGAAATGFGVPISPNKCPSAVPGSTTSVKELPDGVEITVIAPGGAPINDIRQRGVAVVAAAGKEPAPADGLAKCPVVVKDMVVTETDVPGGAAFTVKPMKATALADLKKETKARASSYVP